jgi:hypothetical protein
MAAVPRGQSFGKGWWHGSRKGFHRLVWVLTWAIVGWAHGANAQTIAMQCQLDGAAWQPCRMQVQDIGRTWRIEIGKDTVLFRHDGGGTIAMKQRGRGWRLVQTRWIGVPASAQSALCWDTVCALGAVPLD